MKTKQQQETQAILEIAKERDIYKSFIIQLALSADLSAHQDVMTLIQNARNWSYAHRSGNGEISEEETKRRIRQAADNLTNRD